MTQPESPSSPLRKHHRHLIGLLDQLLALVAAARPDAGPAGPGLVRSMASLERALMAHAEGEDCFLYPEAARLMSDHREATAMNAEHAAVRKLLRNLRAEVDAAADPKLGGLTGDRLGLLSQATASLAEGLRAHFAKEEQDFFPLIDASMTAEEARRRIIDPMSAMSGTVQAPLTRRSERKG